MTWIIQIKEGETPPGGSKHSEEDRLNLALLFMLVIFGLGAGAYIAHKR